MILKGAGLLFLVAELLIGIAVMYLMARRGTRAGSLARPSEGGAVAGRILAALAAWLAFRLARRPREEKI